jgi:molybdenum cofactor cytidylyltransferase
MIPQTSPIAAVILAAGRGSRLGGVCKARLLLREESLLEVQLDALEGAGVGRVVVVCGAEAELVCDLLRLILSRRLWRLEVCTVIVGEGGAQAESVRAGLLALREVLPVGAAWVLVGLVDLPLMSVSSVRRLIDHDAGDAPVVFPVSAQGQRGHPLRMSADYVRALPLADPDFSLRAMTDQDCAGRVAVMVSDDPAYFVDVDTQADLDTVAAKHGICIRRPDPFDTV